MKVRSVVTFASAVLLAGSVACASNVRTDYDHNANFDTIHTYSWGKVTTSNPLYRDRVKAAVDRDLQAKGWQLVPKGGNATVFATDMVKSEKEAETMYSGMDDDMDGALGSGMGWGGGWGWGGWGDGFGAGYGMDGFGDDMGDSVTTIKTQRTAKLVVDVFDHSTHKLMFRGVADNDLGNNSNKNTKNMDKDVKEMFRNFPPKK